MRIYTLVFLAWILPHMAFAQTAQQRSAPEKKVLLIVLGTVQDAGSPHIGCEKACCRSLLEKEGAPRQVVSLGLVDHANEKTFLFEATPNMPAQLRHLRQYAPFKETDLPDGVLLTHAHIGHYTGLMYFGKEAVNAKGIPVYAMPKMRRFLTRNGPWGQLVANHNISLFPLFNNKPVSLTEQISVVPFTVPHRDEYAETVGYTIVGPNKSVLFIPDINKWEHWKTNILDKIKTVDLAFLDATFFDAEEVGHRDISEIPHPFVIESMALFKDLGEAEKKKIHFIHFNHTNPVLNSESAATQKVLEAGFNIARKGMAFSL